MIVILGLVGRPPFVGSGKTGTDGRVTPYRSARVRFSPTLGGIDRALTGRDLAIAADYLRLIRPMFITL